MKQENLDCQTHGYGEIIEITTPIAEDALADARVFVAAIESHTRYATMPPVGPSKTPARPPTGEFRNN